MNRCQQCAVASVIAAALSTTAPAQDYRRDYRYPGAQDTAQQTIPPSPPAQQAQPPMAAPAAGTGQDSRPDYRYPSAQDTARQNLPQPVPAPPQQAQAPVAAPAPAACPGCGTVDSIRVTEKPGEGSAVGLIAGGLLGGLIGHQVGQGRGNTAATIIGAAGGAYAGNQVEKNVRKTVQYQVTVRMDDGSMRTITYDVEPGFRAGDKVRFVDGRLTRS